MKNYKFLIFIFFIIFNSCSKEDEINQLNQTILDLQSNISQLNSQINDYSAQINQLTYQNNLLSSQIENLNNQLNGFQGQIEYYLNQIKLLSQENLILESENNNLTVQLSELQAQLDLIQFQGAEDGVYIFNQIEISDPPFSGTMWELPDLITSSDYTIYSSSTYQGILDRLFYDKSIPSFIDYPAHVYKINFGDGLSVDFEIYTEFSQEEALAIKQKYAPLIGQLGKE